MDASGGVLRTAVRVVMEPEGPGGVRPFMAKAFNIDELIRRVRETLEQRSFFARLTKALPASSQARRHRTRLDGLARVRRCTSSKWKDAPDRVCGRRSEFRVRRAPAPIPILAIIDPVAREYTGRPFPFRDPAGRVALGLVSGQIYYYDCHRTTRYQGTRPAPPNRRMAAKSRADCVSWCCGENSSTLEAEVRQQRREVAG
jgi:hypothetical protein